ncbi:helix-turn-helix domain-containing protein [Fredinandcohnia salidurans]|uniref:Helix-turn-helix domain-containing protein n=1 Tax=Fredinandcohnia salidurans TaxID=2595041 RepID=A0ABW4MS33_9BACI
MLTLGNRIKYVRKTNKLNQVEFAKLIGVSQGTLSEIEKGKYNPSLEIIISIHKNFKVDLEWLLVNSNEVNGIKNTYISVVEDKEIELYTLFRKLSKDDQDEILAIMDLKIKRYNG